MFETLGHPPYYPIDVFYHWWMSDNECGIQSDDIFCSI